jgi:acetyl esterase
VPGGASAGAKLAAATALMTRDRKGPALVLQVLEIPVVDFTDPDPLCITDEGVKVSSGKEQYRDYYLSDLTDASHPYASPLLAKDFKNLPPAVVMCAQYDPLRAEGEAYAKQLIRAGVNVEWRTWEGQFHGSQHLAALIPGEVAAYELQIAQALQCAYT